VEVADHRTATRATISGTASAAASLLTVTRTSSLPASCRRAHLRRGGVHVGGVGVGHRLNDDRVRAATFTPPTSATTVCLR